MNLKDIYQKYRKEINNLGFVILFVIVVVIFFWFTSSSVTNVPKAEQHEVNANAEQQKAVGAEIEANTIRDQKVIAHSETVRSKSNSNNRKEQYEQVRKTANSNGVSGANLDTRESKLRSDLDQLYPDR